MRAMGWQKRGAGRPKTRGGQQSGRQWGPNGRRWDWRRRQGGRRTGEAGRRAAGKGHGGDDACRAEGRGRKRCGPAGGNQRAGIKALLNRFGLGQGARRFVCRVCVKRGRRRRDAGNAARARGDGTRKRRADAGRQRGSVPAGPRCWARGKVRQCSDGGGQQEEPGDQAERQEPAGAGLRRFPTPGRADDAFSLPLPEDQQGVG
mgnify:CR=1 FL=1